MDDPRTAAVLGDGAVRPVEGSQPRGLSVAAVPVLNVCVGERWEQCDRAHLARLVSLIAMGQAAHAAEVIRNFEPAHPAVVFADLVRDAIGALSVRGDTAKKRAAMRMHRDGFIFEAISWIAAQQQATEFTLMRDPHVNPTTQGLDGLIVELDPVLRSVTRVTICEDKCTGNPRRTFLEVIEGFGKLHDGCRSPELVAGVAALLAGVGLSGTSATQAASRVGDPTVRAYRSSFAIRTRDDNEAWRRRQFRGFDAIGDLNPNQRVAATFVTSDNLRSWFDAFAADAIGFLETLPEPGDV